MAEIKLKIEYAEDLVVALKRHDEWEFYVTSKDLWLMDRRRWAQSFIDAGYNISADDHSARFGIPVLNDDTIEAFLDCVKTYKYTVAQLSEALCQVRRANPDDAGAYHPALLLDFDEKRLISYFPEPFPFEIFVPSGWRGEYADFSDRIPLRYRYWET